MAEGYGTLRRLSIGNPSSPSSPSSPSTSATSKKILNFEIDNDREKPSSSPSSKINRERTGSNMSNDAVESNVTSELTQNRNESKNDDVDDEDELHKEITNEMVAASLESINPKFIFDPPPLLRGKSKRGIQKRNSLVNKLDIDGHNVGEFLIFDIVPGQEGVQRRILLRDLYAEINQYVKETDAASISVTAKTSSGSVDKATSPMSPQLPSTVSNQHIATDSFSSSSSSTSTSKSDLEHPTKVNHPANNYSVLQFRLRDLRKLDPEFNPHQEPTIFIRRHMVLFCFDPFRAIIMANRLYFIIPDGADSILSALERHMKDWNSVDAFGDPQSFEIHAYEALLMTVKTLQLADFNRIHNNVTETLQQIKKGSLLSIESQEKLRMYKNNLSSAIAKVSSYRRGLNDLLEDDEVMALMNLTPLKNKSNLYTIPLSAEILRLHEEVEELLETYVMDFNNLESKLEFLRTQIHSAEELIYLRLETSRNELLIANTGLSILACSIAFGSYIAGIFGMNLDNAMYMPSQVIQTTRGSFAIVFVGSFVMIFIIWQLVYYYLQYKGVLPVRIKEYSHHHHQHHHLVNSFATKF